MQTAGMVQGLKLWMAWWPKDLLSEFWEDKQMEFSSWSFHIMRPLKVWDFDGFWIPITPNSKLQWHIRLLPSVPRPVHSFDIFSLGVLGCRGRNGFRSVSYRDVLVVISGIVQGTLMFQLVKRKPSSKGSRKALFDILWSCCSSLLPWGGETYMSEF